MTQSRTLHLLSTVALGATILAAPVCAQTAARSDTKDRLNSSPRHHEWATVATESRPIEAFVVYPETKTKSTVVVVIHQNRGLTDWERGVADRLAQEGFIAVAPDMLSGRAKDGGRTPDFADRDAARDALYAVDRTQLSQEIDAVIAWAAKLEAGNGKVTVAGFCWGGSNTFSAATRNQDPKAFFVFYGGPPDQAALAAIEAPVYGFYGERDERINSTIEATTATMEKLGKFYQPVIYSGAGHAFMAAAEGEEADEATVAAARDAWQRWLTLLKAL